jgi:phospholipid/cholesterol/gamma-HCH transport system substrate-binding protein
METKANHVLIGAFTILITVLAVFFALWAANYSSNKQWDKYEVVFSEAVTGLGTGGIVQYNGINVGEVTKLRLDPEGSAQGDRAHPPAGRHAGEDRHQGQARLHRPDRRGADPAHRRPAGEPAPAADAGAADPAHPDHAFALQNLSAAADDIVERIRGILSDENVARISGTLDDIHQLSSSVAAQKDDSRRADQEPARSQRQPQQDAGAGPRAASTPSTRRW